MATLIHLVLFIVSLLLVGAGVTEYSGSIWLGFAAGAACWILAPQIKA